jgi:hypothetical protein
MGAVFAEQDGKLLDCLTSGNGRHLLVFLDVAQGSVCLTPFLCRS